MFESQTSDSPRLISTITLLLLAVIFIPALLAVSQPINYFSVILAATFSMFCVLIVWFNRKKAAAVKVK
jgi:hypothetical protein